MGDIESQPFLESIRQFQHEVGKENAILIHVTLIPYLKASQEMKTKPTQASVKELQGMGIQPDIIVCRSEYPLDQHIKDKIALFCNVPNNRVLQNLDVEYLYEAPLAMENEHLAQVALECLNLDCPEPDLADWKAMVEALRTPLHEVNIAIVGKYVQLHDAFLQITVCSRETAAQDTASAQSPRQLPGSLPHFPACLLRSPRRARRAGTRGFPEAPGRCPDGPRACQPSRRAGIQGAKMPCAAASFPASTPLLSSVSLCA